MSIAIEYLYHQKKVIADRYIPLDPRTYLKIYYKLDVLSEEAFEKTLQSMVDQLNSAYERDNVERIKIMDTDELGSSHAYMWKQDFDEFMKNLKLYLDVVKCNPDLVAGRVSSSTLEASMRNPTNGPPRQTGGDFFAC